MGQRVSHHALDEVELGITQRVVAHKRCVEGREPPDQRRQEKPPNSDGRSREQVANVDIERRCDRVVPQDRGGDLKGHEQALFVVDNLWLTRHDVDVGGAAVAVVGDEHPKRGRHRGLNQIVGEGVVAVDVARQKVPHVNLCVGANRDGRRVEPME